MLPEILVSCMPEDNYNPLPFKTAGSHIRRNESTALEPIFPDKTAAKRQLRGGRECWFCVTVPEECHILPKIPTKTVSTTGLLPLVIHEKPLQVSA